MSWNRQSVREFNEQIEDKTNVPNPYYMENCNDYD